MPSIHRPQWDRDEEYRQSVIRKAQLLGFGCVHTPKFTWDGRKEGSYGFSFNGETYTGYASIYSAAYEFLRLQGLSHLAGDYRG